MSDAVVLVLVVGVVDEPEVVVEPEDVVEPDVVVEPEVVIEPDVVDVPDVVAGTTFNVTGTEVVPPLSTMIVTMAVYVPAANPADLTTNTTCAVLVMVPTAGDAMSHVALSVAIQ